MQSPKKLTTRSLLLMVITASAASVANADGLHKDSEGPQWGLGLALSSEKTPYKGMSTQTEALPLITYENQWVRVFGPSADLKLGRAGPFSYALTAQYSSAGYSSGDSSYLKGMEKRKGAVWVGGRVNWESEIANVSVELLADASGNSKGQQVKLGVEKDIPLGALSLTPHASINWQDKKYVDYYYGVKASEAIARRAAYTGASGVSTELGIRMNYTLAPRQSLFLDLTATALPSSIKDSPLVDRSSSSEIRVGYLYRF